MTATAFRTRSNLSTATLRTITRAAHRSAANHEVTDNVHSSTTSKLLTRRLGCGAKAAAVAAATVSLLGVSTSAANADVVTNNGGWGRSHVSCNANTHTIDVTLTMDKERTRLYGQYASASYRIYDATTRTWLGGPTFPTTWITLNNSWTRGGIVSTSLYGHTLYVYTSYSWHTGTQWIGASEWAPSYRQIYNNGQYAYRTTCVV